MLVACETPSKYRKDSDALQELLQHKDSVDLNGASVELQALVCKRWQGCDNFECCKADGFHTFYCDCRNREKMKLEWKPPHPSLAQKQRQEKQFFAAVRYVGSQFPEVDDDAKLEIARQHIMKYRFKYDVDLMREARSIVQQLKQPQTCQH